MEKHFSEKYKDAFLEDLSEYEEEMRYCIERQPDTRKALEELEKDFDTLRERYRVLTKAVSPFDDDGAMVAEMAREFSRVYRDLMVAIVGEE